MPRTSGDCASSSGSSGASGFSHASQSGSASISGIRSWISASSPTASVVMIVQLSSGAASLAGFHTDHRPAMNNVSPSLRCRKNGVLAVFLPAEPPSALAPPFVPAVHRDQAALALRRTAEGRRAGHLVGAGIDQQRAFVVRRAVGAGFHPRRDQTPAHEPHPSGGVVIGLAVPSHDGRDRVGGRDVVIRRVRSIGGLVDRLDFLGQQGRIGRDCETPTHDSMVAEPDSRREKMER